MFNIFNPIKKVIGIKKEEPQKKEKKNLQSKLSEKFNIASSFVERKMVDAVDEYHVIRKKMRNLYQTNYDLGMKHLERGDVSEAAFRFKIVKRFWPENYEAHYQLAYCLVLLGKFSKARQVIEELVKKNYEYKAKVGELIKSIEDGELELAQQEKQSFSQKLKNNFLKNDNG